MAPLRYLAKLLRAGKGLGDGRVCSSVVSIFTMLFGWEKVKGMADFGAASSRTSTPNKIKTLPAP